MIVTPVTSPNVNNISAPASDPNSTSIGGVNIATVNDIVAWVVLGGFLSAMFTKWFR